ncbi:uncharacterized protein LOC121073592 isoform X4 [Cygnus olor]|uniref:uncharacterized protein LOC121073592 isoform X4 n=1 Tax=Cygnus olor TaxID=8869 RepID=UPI001ADE8149|nr:uncharacterized protein LOC121073592 isoform X4 [Cygnus olor]
MDSSGFRLRFLSYTKTCSVRQESTSEDRKSFDRTSSRQRIGLLSGKTTGNTGDLPPEPRSGHGQPLCLSRGSQHSSPEHPLRFASVAQLRFWTSDAFIN